MPRPHQVALYTFGNHSPGWLETVHENLKAEPWGKNLKVLELYLRINFEIAKQQQKVYEDDSAGIAIWRAGFLVTPTMDPVWMYYERNNPKYPQKWNFKGVKIGETPLQGITVDISNYSVKYDPPEFKPKWEIYIDPRNFKHKCTAYPLSSSWKAFIYGLRSYVGKSTDDTGEQTQTDQKRIDKYLFGAALLCRLRGETQLSHGKRICAFPLFHV